MNTFAAIDFETADYESDSACSLSIVRVNETTIEKQFTCLIRPPREEFVFTYIHGISWADVAEEPAFHEHWPQITEILNGCDFIAAHNAPFDKKVLYSCCQKGNILPPTHPFLCTVILSRSLWNFFPTKLPDVCKKLGIKLNHHDAASDALACAKIVIAAIEQGKDFSKWVKS
jgi:DNA polymerase-3 subunit epsilon